jgi:hypothetical protein
MKDSQYTQDWVDDVAIRLRLDDSVAMGPSRPSASPKRPIKRETPRTITRLAPPSAATTTLTRLRELSPSAVLVLFTPVMVPFGFSDHSQAMTKTSQVRAKLETDPFEMLGLALSKQHSRIRHVPYIPTVGFTETHNVFTTRADALIVATCQPEHRMVKVNDTETPDEEHLAMQVAFATRTAESLAEAGRVDEVPMICLHWGDDAAPLEIQTYKDVFAGETYNAESVEQIVQLLFGGRKPPTTDRKQT